MRRSRIVTVAAGAATLALMSPWVRGAGYTWSSFTGGTYDWTTSANWGGSGSPTGAAGAGDSGTILGSITGSGSLGINIAAGSYYVNSLTLGGTGTLPQSIDVGNANSQGGMLIMDGGAAADNVYARIISKGTAGSTNTISAPIELDQLPFYSGSVNGNSGNEGPFDVTGLSGTVSSAFIGALNTNIYASLVFDPSSTNSITLTGTLSNASNNANTFFGGALTNAMSAGQTLTINGPIVITNSASTVASQTFTINGTSGSNTVINGVISDGINVTTVHSAITYGDTNPSKTTVYPALTPTITINNANTYTGVTALDMATLLVGNDQAFGTPQAAGTVPSGTSTLGEIRVSQPANEFGANLEAVNGTRTIDNGVYVGSFLTIEGQNSFVFSSYWYQTTSKEVVNLLPSGKSLTMNGPVYVNQNTNSPSRVWTMDGSGLTIDNGNIYNSATAPQESNGSGLSATLIKNGTGTLLLNGTGSTYRGTTTVNGGLLQFASPGSYGVQLATYVPPDNFLQTSNVQGTYQVPTYAGGNPGTSAITVDPGGAVGVATGSLTAGFLALFTASATSSTGSLALAQGTLDTSTPINFNSAPYSGANLAGLSIGALSGGTSYSGTITPATSSTTLASGLVIAANTYRLGGGGTLTIPGAQLTGAGNSLVAANGGTVALNGLNTYGGTTTIKGVYVLSDANRATKNDFSAGAGALMPQILSVSHLGVGSAASSIGSSSNAAANLVIGGGTLQYTGAGDSTDRLFTMTPTGAALDASGTGPIVFSNTGSVAQTTIAPILATSFGVNSGGGVPFNRAIFPATVDTSGVALGMTVTDSAGQFPAGTVVTGVDSTATGSDVYVSYQTQIGEAFNDTLTFTVQNRALTLTGTNTGANTLDTALVNPASSGTLAINKTGVGTWFLSGANTYTGGTGVNAGILEATGTGSLPGYNVSGNITVASGGTMAVAVGGAGQFTSANIDTLRSNATFSAGSYLGIDTTSAPSGFSYASNITGVLGLNKLGANTLTLSGTDTYSGPTLVSQGTLAVTTTGSIPNSAVTVGGATAGTLNFAASTSGILVRNLTSLNIVNGSANMLAAPTATQNTVRSVLVTPSLTVGTGTDLDLANNDLIEKSTTASSVLSQIKAGFNAPSGYWNGTGGIVSTSAAGNAQYLTALGYMQSTGGSFDGVATTTSDTLVKYTYYGDANLDGSVNGGDYTQIDHGYSMNLTGWQNGDFNYDGVVDGSDYSLIDNTYNQINASGATPLAITAGAADLVASPANVPEPTTLALLGIGTIGLLGRRRRRNA